LVLPVPVRLVSMLMPQMSLLQCFLLAVRMRHTLLKEALPLQPWNLQNMVTSTVQSHFRHYLSELLAAARELEPRGIVSIFSESQAQEIRPERIQRNLPRSWLLEYWQANFRLLVRRLRGTSRARMLSWGVLSFE
jgi:hypothetical protein